MADTVRYLMEESIAELQDLEARGYFSKAELREVARRRMDFEYRLKRRAALKDDFLRFNPPPPPPFPGTPALLDSPISLRTGSETAHQRPRHAYIRELDGNANLLAVVLEVSLRFAAAVLHGVMSCPNTGPRSRAQQLVTLALPQVHCIRVRARATAPAAQAVARHRRQEDTRGLCARAAVPLHL